MSLETLGGCCLQPSCKAHPESMLCAQGKHQLMFCLSDQVAGMQALPVEAPYLVVAAWLEFACWLFHDSIWHEMLWCTGFKRRHAQLWLEVKMDLHKDEQLCIYLDVMASADEVRLSDKSTA